MSEVIVITSGKGGVGKTTTTANVGTGLAMLNKKVVMIDTDIGLRNLDVVLGLENRIVYNLKALIDELKPEFDYILLDCPAGIEQGFKNAIAGADRALVVTTPEVSAIRDADRIVGLLEANEMTRIDLIINRIRMDMVKRGDMLKVEDVCDILSIPLLGVIPDDEQVVVSTNQGDPLVGGSSLAGQAYVNICHRLMGEDVPMMDLDAKKGVMGILRELFRRS